MGTFTAGVLLKHIIKYEQHCCNIMLRSMFEIIITSLAFLSLLNMIIWCVL